MHSIGEKDLFKENQLYSIVRSIPAYPTPTNDYKWNLGYRRAFRWGLKCRESETYSLSEAKRNFNLDMEKQYQFGMVVAAVINFLYGGVFLPITFAQKRAAEAKRAPRSPDKKERRRQRE